MYIRVTLYWGLYTEGAWLYGDCFIWCVSCAVFVLTGYVICGFYNVWVFG
jgi:hypothetical protein